ncbi:MAG: hypothetical protein IJ929_04290 [Prevotella sp.]|nr:hypothetical protein [Prevotella sp.]
MKSKKMRTVTMSGQTSVTTLENGLHYVQSTPDNPVVGQVEPFVGRGRIQMLSNGQLEVTQTRRVRRKPEYRGDYLSFSRGNDGYDRVSFITPSELRADMPRLLQKDVAKLLVYLEEMISSKKKRV